MRSTSPHIWIVSPALANANNGNWQTAKRWARFLRAHWRVTLAPAWPGPSVSSVPSDSSAPASPGPELLIALHARRSAPSLAAFARAWPQRPTLLVLTGTDVYRDIHADRAAQASLALATRLVVLQPAALLELPAPLRSKAEVIYQSAPMLKPAARHGRDVIMIGHLREEKDPLTFMRASALLSPGAARLVHIGGALDPALALAAEATQRANPNYRWLGNLPHAATRQRLKRARLMVIASKMEGGANVIIEAVTSGVPVLASAISGNRGMLGDDYAGYFPVGDPAALAHLIERALADAGFYAQLQAQCAARAALFAPAAEQAALCKLVDNLLTPPPSSFASKIT
jgi:putative glycosyltransferase (TIGR04348 family)